jgi:phosphate transport system substrate-binding protein
MPKEMRDRGGSGRKSSSMALIAIVAVVIIVLAGVGAAYELGWFKSKSNNTGPGGNSNSTANACPTGNSIQGAGSTLVGPLMGVWEQQFTADEVNYQQVGSGTGISDIQTQAVDFGASDAPVSTTQATAFKTNPWLTIPESAGMVALVYNLPGVTQKLNFNWEFISAAFGGTITNWNNSVLQAINPGVTLPSASIIIVHRSDGSGTSYAFTQWMSLNNATWASKYGYATTYAGPTTLSGEIASKGNAGVAASVESTQNSIGYVDLVYALQNGISYGAVENPAGHFIVPSIADGLSAMQNITKASTFSFPSGTDWANWTKVNMENSPGTVDYPITTLTYILVYEHPDVAFGTSSTVMNKNVAESLRGFLLWVVNSTQGQSYSGQEYYIPLPAAIITADIKTINEMTWGGQPLTCTE